MALIAGFSVFYFLYFFEAYGIQKGLSYSGHSHLFRSISFGGLTFTYLLLLEIFVRPRLDINSKKRQIFWYFFLILIGIQLIFLLFNFFWNWQEWNLEAYLLILKEFPLMMIIPFSIYFILNTKQRDEMREEFFVTFMSENGKDQLKIKFNDFLFANSADNYITINHKSNEGLKQHMIRKPLKVLEKEMEAQNNVERIHRSYIINLDNIENIRQEKSKVFVEIFGESLPVSKQFQELILGL